MADQRVDVVVVGAGFAGLTAARELTGAGRSVVVLEARDRVGGRTCTEEHLGTWIDLGGQWIGPGQDRIVALVDQLGLRTYPQTEAGDDVILDGDGARRVANVAFGFDDDELTSYLELVGALEAIAEQVPLEAPWSAPRAQEWDAMSLAEWVRTRGVVERVAGLFEVGVQAVFAASSAQLSLLHAAHYLHSAGGWSKLTDSEGGAQQDRVEGGMQPVAEQLASRLPEGTMRLFHAVTSIAQHDDGVRIGVSAPAGPTELDADRVVVAVPPTLAGRIAYDPPLGAQRDQLVQHMPQGSVVKFHVLYEEPWWRDEGLSGMVLAPGEPIGVTFDCTPPAGRPGLISGFFEGPAAVAAGEQTMEERRDVVVDVLARAMGERARDVAGYVDRDWSAEPFTRGCYGAHLPPGAWTVYGPALRRPIGRIHWAGTETAEHWTGYIDGAIDSGQRVAAEVLAALGG
ncbi:flavin monoamine oxidase family protein [Acidimicrobiia bacterium EGI L10123]|uniref:flavin monoamine oxidase family protein n=1 Tax=Salinilacustrithrix flava TaxID=2957203 RepID=UPI003D7C220D|nr:flavin monoamine oxidase family protein [Acidimicrobiia bacterium EGI L10123]